MAGLNHVIPTPCFLPKVYLLPLLFHNTSGVSALRADFLVIYAIHMCNEFCRFLVLFEMYLTWVDVTVLYYCDAMIFIEICRNLFMVDMCFVYS